MERLDCGCKGQTISPGKEPDNSLFFSHNKNYFAVKEPCTNHLVPKSNFDDTYIRYFFECGCSAIVNDTYEEHGGGMGCSHSYNLRSKEICIYHKTVEEQIQTYEKEKEIEYKKIIEEYNRKITDFKDKHALDNPSPFNNHHITAKPTGFRFKY